MEDTMVAARRVTLFRSGANQAVRIPREFELPGEDAIMRKEGRRLVIEPAPGKSILATSILAQLASLSPPDKEFPPLVDEPPEPVDIGRESCREIVCKNV